MRFSREAGRWHNVSTTEQEHHANDGDPGGPLVFEVTRTMVELYKQVFGRGPTKARTYWCGPDALTTILEDTLIAPERALVKIGEHERLRDQRTFLQFASVREFCEPIEKLTSRKVRSFQSSIDTEADGLSIETFILYPKGYEGPSRIDRAES
jgi:uncharacterized protein YbcI